MKHHNDYVPSQWLRLVRDSIAEGNKRAAVRRSAKDLAIYSLLLEMANAHDRRGLTDADWVLYTVRWQGISHFYDALPPSGVPAPAEVLQ